MKTIENKAPVAPKSEERIPRKRPEARDHVQYVADALMRLQNRLRIAEKGLFGDQKGKVQDLRRAVLSLSVKADDVASDLAPGK